MHQINLPKARTTFSTISEQSPDCCIRTDSLNQAIDFAMSDQPAYRPWYIVKCTETYEFCATIGKNGSVKVYDNAQPIDAIPRKAIDDAIAEIEEHIQIYEDEGDKAADNYISIGLSASLKILKKHIAEVEK